MMAGRWRQSGGVATGQVATDVPTNVPTDVPPTAGASAPFGARVVREYVKAGGQAGRDERAALGLNAKRLRDRGASESDILAAVREFARTKRWPRYIREWTTEKQIGDEIAAHQARKSDDRRAAPQTMRRLSDALKEAGL